MVNICNSFSGDVNLFLNDPEDDQVGEIEVMIAEESFRQKGCATEALKQMMGFCYDKIHVSRFVAKIGKHNLKSYSLFKNKVIFLLKFQTFLRILFFLIYYRML
jgi:RimJ/RimL family protein N-acetyltransferase